MVALKPLCKNQTTGAQEQQQLSTSDMSDGPSVPLAFIENTKISLVTALSADGKYCGITQSGTAGETLVFGNICYLKASDSKWWKAKADVAATSGPVKLGFCVLAGNANDTITILQYGKIRADSLFDTFTISAPIFVSAATAGKVVSAAPTGTTNFVVRIVGRANTGDEIMVDISPDYIELA